VLRVILLLLAFDARQGRLPVVSRVPPWFAGVPLPLGVEMSLGPVCDGVGGCTGGTAPVVAAPPCAVPAPGPCAGELLPLVAPPFIPVESLGLPAVPPPW
jgi:hypothetical protein